MSLSDPLGDMLTRIRNGQQRRRNVVQTPGSRLRASVLDVLKAEGYITDLRVTKTENNKAELEIVLNYFEGKPVIATLKRFSRSGLRQYRGKAELPKVLNGLGIAIISTSKGIMTDAQARQLGVGGEVLDALRFGHCGFSHGSQTSRSSATARSTAAILFEWDRSG